MNLVGPSLRDIAALEAAIFTAWFRRDWTTAAKWFAQVKKLKQMPRLLQLRANIALGCARCDFDAALACWQEGFRLIENLPIIPSNSCLKESWLEWETEIKERQAQAVAV